MRYENNNDVLVCYPSLTTRIVVPQSPQNQCSRIEPARPGCAIELGHSGPSCQTAESRSFGDPYNGRSLTVRSSILQCRKFNYVRHARDTSSQVPRGWRSMNAASDYTECIFHVTVYTVAYSWKNTRCLGLLGLRFEQQPYNLSIMPGRHIDASSKPSITCRVNLFRPIV